LGFGGGGAGGGSPLNISGGGAGAVSGQAANVWRSGRTGQPMTPSFGTTTAPAVTKQSTLGSAPGRPGPTAEPSAARIKSVSPSQPLNAPGQNVWRSGRTGEPMRSPGDKAQNIDDYVVQNRDKINQFVGRQNIDDFVMQRAGQSAARGGPIPIPPAPGERLAGAAGAAVPVAVGAGIYAADKGAKPTSGQSTPQAPARDPNMTQQMRDRLGIPLNSQGRTASGATPAQTPAAATSTRPAGPQQGVVGSELGRLSGGEFASRADRLNQARVDDILGPGYKAGSAAANTALRDYYKANPPESDAQRQELAQKIFNQSMDRMRQQAAQAQADLKRDNPGLSTEPAGNDDSTVTVPEDKNQLMRLLKLSGQR